MHQAIDHGLSARKFYLIILTPAVKAYVLKKKGRPCLFRNKLAYRITCRFVVNQKCLHRPLFVKDERNMYADFTRVFDTEYVYVHPPNVNANVFTINFTIWHINVLRF